MSLRDELVGAPSGIPQYSLVLPSGWAEYDTSAEAEQQLLNRATRRLREQHRPDVAAQLLALTGRAFGGLRSAATHRIYLQTEGWSDDLILPLSITASVRTAPGHGSLDGIVADLIRDRGATALGGDKRFVRWQSDGSVDVGGSRVGQHTIAYLTPFPEPGRRRALQFTAVIVHPSDDPTEAWKPLVTRMGELTDAIVSTLRWHAA